MPQINHRYGYMHYENTDSPERAQAIANYFDEKYVITHEAMGAPVGSKKVRIEFFDDCGACADPIRRIIKVGRPLLPKDLGVVLHETVHIIQNYHPNIYGRYKFLAEGMAEYVRLILSNDKMGDTGTESKKYLPKEFNLDPGSDSTPEFIAYIKKNGCSIAKLNQLLTRGDESIIAALFDETFHKPWQNVLTDYGARRNEIVGMEPARKTRYEYFTD